jgi:hypothetical protein
MGRVYIKRDDTVRAFGQASVGTDKPTRDKLKAAAAAAGMPVSDYMRILADQAIKDIQGGFGAAAGPTGKQSDISRKVEQLCTMAIKMSEAIPMSKARRLSVLSLANRHIKFDMLKQAQWLHDTIETEFNAYSEKVAAKEAGQLEWKVA